MEKIKISEVRKKFKDLPKNTPSTLRYKADDRELFLKVEGFEPLKICCDICGGEKSVKEGVLFRCFNCDSLFLIGHA
jgi:hypothetical protein